MKPLASDTHIVDANMVVERKARRKVWPKRRKSGKKTGDPSPILFCSVMFISVQLLGHLLLLHPSNLSSA